MREAVSRGIEGGGVVIWQRSKVARQCGACGAAINVGDPVLMVSSAYLSRCVKCAKAQYQTEPPASLEPLPKVDVPQAQPFSPARELARRTKASFDARMARTGEQ